MTEFVIMIDFEWYTHEAPWNLANHGVPFDKGKGARLNIPDV